jgi:hypothetical protein
VGEDGIFLYKPRKYVCKMRVVREVSAAVLHFLCVVSGITHASSQIMKLMHFVNLGIRLVTLGVGVMLVTTNGSPCAPGVAMVPYKESEWVSLTRAEWSENKLPSMDAVLQPSNSIVMTLWFVVVVHLFIADAMRCTLVMNDLWFSRENHADMIWSAQTLTIFPLLFVLVAMQLGTFDLVTLFLMAFIAVVSGICGATLEHLRTLVNPNSTLGISNTVVWMLRVVQDVAMIVASQVAFTPKLMNIFYHDAGHADTAYLLLSTLFTAFVYALGITNYRHNRLCSIFEATWPTRFSMIPWGLDTDSLHTHDSLATTPVASVTQSPGMYTTTKVSHFPSKPTRASYFSGKTSESAKICNKATELGDFHSKGIRFPGTCGKLTEFPDTYSKLTEFPDTYSNMPALPEDTHDPLDSEKSEALFNALYGCHLYEQSPSADFVHIVDQDHKVITVNLTEDFNVYGQLYGPRGIARDGVLANGPHIARIGAAPQVFHHHIDQDGRITRKMIGVLTEWRRYYIINAFIDALLITSLLNITGVMGTCAI